MASREAYDFAGPFDGSLKALEDWDLWVRMSRKYDFHESHMIDCECSFRTDNSQMTGARTGYVEHLPNLYGRWRQYASNYQWVVDNQNQLLRSGNIDPEAFGL